MKSVPTGTVEYTDNNSNNGRDIVISETSRVIPELNVILEYDSAMLEYDHEITEAMNSKWSLQTTWSTEYLTFFRFCGPYRHTTYEFTFRFGAS